MAPYAGDNFMEILTKKATIDPPDALSTFRTDVPPELEALIVRALSREPGNRPRSMTRWGAELRRSPTRCSRFGMAPFVESEKFPRAGVLGALRGGAAQASGLYERMRRSGVTGRPPWAPAGRWCSSSRTWSPARRCTAATRTTRSRRAAAAPPLPPWRRRLP